MSARATLATAVRVLQQLRRDPRTIALLLVTPIALVALMKWILSGQPSVFQRVGVPLLGVFPLASMFLVTSITMLRERTTGTLERLMTLPIAKADLLLGYALAFGLLATLQATAVATVAFGLLDLHVAGPPSLVVGLAIINALLGMSLGLLVSAFARSEFQAVQFMPALLLPQILLCGLIAPRDRMARPLEIASDYLPMSYAYDALSRVAENRMDGRLAIDVAVLLGFSIGALAVGAATLRRRTE